MLDQGAQLLGRNIGHKLSVVSTLDNPHTLSEPSLPRLNLSERGGLHGESGHLSLEIHCESFLFVWFGDSIVAVGGRWCKRNIQFFSASIGE